MAEHIKVLVSEEEVDKRIRELGEQISKDYAGKEVHLICVLKGGVFFMCELAKRITVPVTMDFMSVSSYGAGTESSGVVKIVKDLDQPLEPQGRTERISSHHYCQNPWGCGLFLSRGKSNPGGETGWGLLCSLSKRT